MRPSKIPSSACSACDPTGSCHGLCCPLHPAGALQRVGLFLKSIHGTLNHLLVGQHHLWFVRFADGISPNVALAAELESDRARLDARLREGAARWAPLIASFKPDRWSGTLDYTTMRGTAASLPFAATL